MDYRAESQGVKPSSLIDCRLAFCNLSAILRLTSAGLLALVVVCAARSQFERHDESGSPPVRVGHYEQPFDMINFNHRSHRSVKRLRSDVERHEAWLRRAVRDRLDANVPLEFRFMYAGYDSVNRRLLLRYFAPNPNPMEIAGWQVQLVYSGRCPRLREVWVEALPLE